MSTPKFESLSNDVAWHLSCSHPHPLKDAPASPPEVSSLGSTPLLECAQCLQQPPKTSAHHSSAGVCEHMCTLPFTNTHCNVFLILKSSQTIHFFKS